MKATRSNNRTSTKEPPVAKRGRLRKARSAVESKKMKIRVVSLFCGAGGLDLGFRRAGLSVVWANDFDADCVETYLTNVDPAVVYGDISKVDVSTIPDCDVVVGGFPCQGFSLANLRRHGDDERNSLYRQFLRVLRAKRPAYFVAENVRGLLSLEGGEVAKEIVKGFERCGYRVRYRVLNAADYGVPQTRNRVIFLGTRSDIAVEQDVSFPVPTHSRKATGSLLPWVSVAEALRSIPEPDAEHLLKNHVCSQYKVTNRNFTGHRATDGTKPSPTILARGNGRGGVCAIQHPGNHRRMSVRESASVQTFPLDFEFAGKLNSMYRQVGNAVPVVLAERIGNEIMRAFVKRKTT